MADTSWLDDAPDAAWLDEAPVATPRTGMGDVRAAEAEDERFATATKDYANVPVTALTGDPATDRQISENIYAQGGKSPLTKGDALRAGAIGLGLGGMAIPGVPAAMLSGGLMAGGMSEADDPVGILKDSAVGAGISGTVAKVLPPLFGKVAGFARDRLGRALAKATAEQAKERASAIGSAAGSRNAAIAENNRVVEWIRNLLENESALGAEGRQVLEQARGTPEYQQAVEALVRRLPQRLTEAGQQLAQGEQALASARALPPVAEMAAERVSSPVARQKIWDRVIRYGPPAIGSAIGASVGGPEGVAIGALAGAGTRPAVHAIRRMIQDPAVQTQLWTPVARGFGALSQAPVAGPAAMTENDFLAWLRAKIGQPQVGLIPATADEEEPR